MDEDLQIYRKARDGQETEGRRRDSQTRHTLPCLNVPVPEYYCHVLPHSLSYFFPKISQKFRFLIQISQFIIFFFKPLCDPNKISLQAAYDLLSCQFTIFAFSSCYSLIVAGLEAAAAAWGKDKENVSCKLLNK